MSNCGCNSKNHCCDSVRGERGLQGKVGPQGPAGPAGPAGGGIVNRFNFFQEVIETETLLTDQFTQPGGYSALKYINVTTDPIILIAHANGEALLNLDNNDDVSNRVDMALVKISSGVQDYTHVSNMTSDLRIGLFDEIAPGVTVLRIDSPASPRVVTTDEGNPVEIRFAQATLHQTGATMKKVTLLPGESIHLMFKNKGSQCKLLSAQLFLQELDQ